MAVHTRFSKPCWFAALLVVSTSASALEDGGASTALTERDRAWIESSRQARDQASEAIDLSAFANPHSDQAQRDADAFFDQLQQTNPTLRSAQRQQQPEATDEVHDILIFASRSLAQEGLQDIFEIASQDPGVAVVFRGVPEDMKVGPELRALQAMAAEFDPMPNVVLDPTMFREYNVTSVPTIVMLEQGDAKGAGERNVRARVEGLSDPAWLERRLERGEEGDFGRKGPVAEIEEPDLIEVMQERVAEIDWAAKREQAIQRFWSNQSFQWLPPATESRTRRIDPHVYVMRDITAPDGSVIAQRGSRINPLDMRPFTQAVVVFDPLDHRQMELIERIVPKIAAEPDVQRLTYIATQMDAEAGWDGYRQVTDRVDAPVYLLTPDLIERFRLEHTPSVITSDGEAFVVRELTQEDTP